jgi:hypothetical protein
MSCHDQVTIHSNNSSSIQSESQRLSASASVVLALGLPTMSQVMPHLTYPGGYSAFFTDLHLNFPRWLRLVTIVPLVHASIGGISYEELCFHVLHVFPSSPSNVLMVSAERIRSSVAEMLSSEPFFIVSSLISLQGLQFLISSPSQCSFPDNGPTLSTSRWVYESSFDSDPSRISFAFCVLRCINLFPSWSVRDTLSGLTSVAVLPNISISMSDEEEPQSAYDGCYYMPPHSTRTAAVRVSNSSVIGPVTPQARTGLDSPNQRRSQPSVSGSVMTPSSPRPDEPLYPHSSVLIQMGLTASRENLHPDPSHVSTYRSMTTPRRFCVTTQQSGTEEDAAMDSSEGAQSEVPVSDFLARPDQRPNQVFAGRCDPSRNRFAKSPLFLPSQTPIRDLSAQDILSSPCSGIMLEDRNMLQDSQILCTGRSYSDRLLSNPVYTSTIQYVGTDTNTDVDGALRVYNNRTLLTRAVTDSRPSSPAQWPDGFPTSAYPQVLSAESDNPPPCACLPNLSERRGGVSHEAIPVVFPQADGDMASSAALVCT